MSDAVPLGDQESDRAQRGQSPARGADRSRDVLRRGFVPAGGVPLNATSGFRAPTAVAPAFPDRVGTQIGQPFAACHGLAQALVLAATNLGQRRAVRRAGGWVVRIDGQRKLPRRASSPTSTADETQSCIETSRTGVDGIIPTALYLVQLVLA